ncbi:MAG: RNA methyltransferase [Muribaculaceae bacterium]|nr:RNA methyltransferase [Muribaculaceae bacterium]
MIIREIAEIEDDRVMDFSRLTECQLRSRLRPEDARIIVESPKVIKTALKSGHTPISILTERKHIEGDAKEIIAIADRMTGGAGIDVFTADRGVLASLTGYTLTRGVLCAMRRPKENSMPEVMEMISASDDSACIRVGVLDGVCDSTNIGAIFRSAAALGLDALLLTRDCCDPYSRRAIRVSMGSVFLLPWGWIDSVDDIREYKFKTIAMALRDDSIGLDDPRLKEERRLAMVMGTEGDGLAADVILGADYVVKIPMSHGVDSLNVAAASAVAFWELVAKRNN